MPAIGTQNYSFPISRFGDSPPEGFAALPVSYNLDGSNNGGRGFAGDYVLGQARGSLTQLRTVFVDNAANASPLNVTWDSGQSINVAAYSQGYYPVLSPGDIRFTVTSNGGTLAAPITVTVWLVNVLLPCVVWSVRGLPISVNYNGSGDQQIPLFAPNAVKRNDITATDAAILAGAPGYFVRGFDFTVSPGATLAAAGDLVVSLTDSTSGAFWRMRLALPGVPWVPNQPTILRGHTPPDFLWTAKAAATTLSITLSAALTAGLLSYNLNYGTTNFVG